MKKKIFLLFFLFTFSANLVKAYEFNFLFRNFFSLPSFSSKSSDIIYRDTEGHWCDYAAKRLYNEGIFTGIKIGSDYYFEPDEYITRGEFLLYLNAVLKKQPKSTASLPFSDAHTIPEWQLPTVNIMHESGFIKGNIENGLLFFNHDEKISRLECAIILNNILELNNDEKDTAYFDNYLIPAYAVTAVKNVSDYGLMNGYEDNSFRPYIKITRAMLANILCNVKDYGYKR